MENFEEQQFELGLAKSERLLWPRSYHSSHLAMLFELPIEGAGPEGLLVVFEVVLDPLFFSYPMRYQVVSASL